VVLGPLGPLTKTHGVAAGLSCPAHSTERPRRLRRGVVLRYTTLQAEERLSRLGRGPERGHWLAWCALCCRVWRGARPLGRWLVIRAAAGMTTFAPG